MKEQKKIYLRVWHLYRALGTFPLEEELILGRQDRSRPNGHDAIYTGKHLLLPWFSDSAKIINENKHALIVPDADGNVLYFPTSHESQEYDRATTDIEKNGWLELVTLGFIKRKSTKTSDFKDGGGTIIGTHYDRRKKEKRYTSIEMGNLFELECIASS